jgi:hypothetical protein
VKAAQPKPLVIPRTLEQARAPLAGRQGGTSSGTVCLSHDEPTSGLTRSIPYLTSCNIQKRAAAAQVEKFIDRLGAQQPICRPPRPGANGQRKSADDGVSRSGGRREQPREGQGGEEVKPSTFASYEARWTKHIAPKWGKRRVGEVSREELKTWLKALQEKTSLDTRRKVQQVIHKLFAVAVGEGWRPINPADGIPMPGVRIEREPNALTDQEIEKIAAEVPARYRALVWTLAETGARIGELTALRVQELERVHPDRGERPRGWGPEDRRNTQDEKAASARSQSLPSCGGCSGSTTTPGMRTVSTPRATSSLGSGGLRSGRATSASASSSPQRYG